MEGNVAVSGVDRPLIASQGILNKGVYGLIKRKKTNKEMKQVQKQQPKPKAMPKTQPKPSASGYRPTKEDSAFSKRNRIPMSEIIGQGGVTPQSVTNEIKKTGGYTVRMKSPSGLYKKTTKNK